MKDKRAVIIGAGQTGRGFIAPILEDDHYQLVFLDRDAHLIADLNMKKEYEIAYFGGARPIRKITNYSAFTTTDLQSMTELINADLVITSVFASNIAALVPLLKKAANQRQQPMTIICCENGINVKQPLVEAGFEAVISEGVIFCTTLKQAQSNLISQDYPELPIDGSVAGLNVVITGMPLEQNFEALIQRKIYTYNFLSAVVAYLGSYLGYEVYGEAANDPEINKILRGVLPIISTVIAKEYQVSETVQWKFSNLALTKFENKEIHDTISRNAQQVERKLQLKERLLTPLMLARKYQQPTGIILLVIAAAIHYGKRYEDLVPEGIYQILLMEFSDQQLISEIKRQVERFDDQEELRTIVEDRLV